MVKKYVDLVFGEMEYDHGWTKQQDITFLDKVCDVEIFVTAYTGESIVGKQCESYKFFIENQGKINSELPKLIQNYIDKNKKEIKVYYPEIENITNLSDIVRLKTILFERDGHIIFLCDTSWNEENGIGIQVYPEYKIDIQDVFL